MRPIYIVGDNNLGWSRGRTVLERAIKRAGFAADQFIMRPLTNLPKDGVALALGDDALFTLTGLAGKYQTVRYLHGYLLRGPGDVTVIPTFHPADVGNGQMHLFSALIYALRRAVQCARESEQPGSAAPAPGHVLHPTEADAWEFLRRVERSTSLLLAYDIETPYSAVTDENETDDLSDTAIYSIQFSTGRGTGIYFPWEHPFDDIARALLATPNDKLGQNNWRFDDPLLRAHGCVLNGIVHDIRWAWHHLQPELPANLQFIASFYGFPFPWKHLFAADVNLYGVCDVDALHYIGPALFDQLRAQHLWRGYERHVLKLEPILDAMSRRGMPVSPERHAEVSAQLTASRAEAWGKLQAAVPDAVRPIHPKLGYKNEPKDAVIGGATTHAGEPAVWARRYFPFPITVEVEKWLPGRQPGEPVSKETAMGMVHEERWVKLLPFVPSDGVNGGLLRYMQHMGHKLPVTKDGKFTTSELALKRLAKSTEDPVYALVLEIGDADTMLNNHLKNWAPASDGRVHPTFYYETATGQLASRRPNVQNAPKHKASQGDLFRSMIVPRPGHMLIELDYKSFHAQTLAFLAGDPDYLRLAKLDIHSFLTAHLVRDPHAKECITWDDGKLRAYLGGIKREHKFVRDYKAKRAILGYGFGMGYRKLYEMNRESFENQAEAKRTLDMLDRLFPRTKQFRDDIRKRAHREGKLVSPAGSVRYFWEVYRWSEEKGWLPGNDSESAIAFLPANVAFGHLKDCVIRLEEQGWLARAGFINTIHDALMFECPLQLVDEAIAAIATEMERPSEVLVGPVAPNGLSVEVGVSVGSSWDKMEDYKLVKGVQR